MADETKLFTFKLSKLKEILISLKCHKFSQRFIKDLQILGTQLDKLQVNVEKEGSLNAGGKFEWVDSILIKCLQDGCWLLIENVNLCSPAVLDRLNALLEPNGILTIGERGVDKNGEMINIVPHPNFRLFLTMDPKNGEISRAMRNRGVEIYMLNESETANRNQYDTNALINQNGISCEKFQEILVQLHDYISTIVLGDKPTISHTLQASFLISQQLLRGINIIDAFSSSVIDVYVRIRSVNDFTIPDPVETIQLHIEKTLEDNLNESYISTYMVDNKTIKTMDLQTHSNFELIQHQTVLICQLLKDEFVNNLAQYILLGYTISSANNFQLRHAYLTKELKAANEKYAVINEKLFVVLSEYFRTKNENSDLPLESRWLPDSMNCYTDTNQINQMFVLMYFTILKAVNEMENIDLSTGKKFTNMTVMQYSKAVFDKKLSQFFIEHPLILNFYNLITSFDNFLTSLLKKLRLKLSSEDAVFCSVLLNWRFVLQEMGNIIVYDKKDKSLNLNTVLSHLTVRYKWFVKHTVGYFLKFSNEEISVELSKILKVINASMENNFSSFSKIAKHFTKTSPRSLPLINEEQIAVLASLNETVYKLSFMSRNDSKLQEKCSLLLNSSELIDQLVQCKKEFRIDYKTVEENLNKVKESINSFSEKELKLSEVQLLPIKDIFGLYIVNCVRNNIFVCTSVENKNLTDEKCRMLKKIITVPPDLAEILETYFDTRDEKLIHELSLAMTSYFKNSISLSPSTYLFWNKKDDEDFKIQHLSAHVPCLTYSITSLCVSNTGNQEMISITNLGQCKEKSDQLRYLNELIWQNNASFSANNFNFTKNDANYVLHSFENFILLLEKSLTGENTNAPAAEKVNVCIQKINEIYDHNTASSDTINSKKKILSIFDQLYRETETLKTADKLNVLIHTANVYCLLNYINTLLNSQLQVIDPLEKIVLKKKYCEEERIICTDMKDAFVLQNEIYSGNLKALHPFCAILATKIKVYETREIELAKHVAARPNNISYQSLLKDVLHNLNTLVSDEFFMNMYEKLNSNITLLKEALNTKSNINLEGCRDALSQSANWLFSQENSVSKLAKYRIGYPDIIEPLLSNITELSYGVKLLNTTLKKLTVKYEYLHQDLNEFMGRLVQFPVLDESQKSVINLIELCTHSKNISLVSKIIGNEEAATIVKQENLRMLLCGIQEIYNMFVINAPPYLDRQNNMLVYLENLIDLFISAWHKQETEKQKKIEEEQSLYKTKSKCENLSEEEEMYRDMKQLFPNFHEKDFSDFQEATLEDTKTETTDPDESEFVGVITEEDVRFVCNIHSELLQRYTRNEWLNPKKKSMETNFIKPLLQRFKLFNLLKNKIIEGMDCEVENKIISSLNLLISITKSYGEGDDILAGNQNSPSKAKVKNYDFYKDSKVEEIKSCLHVLEALKTRIVELLSEWPGHPTLNAISTIIERVYSFPMTSPVSRFLTGLEVLLSKCHEWEENAHSGVSLSEFTQNLTLQIISWRKLELAGWKDCLNNTLERSKSAVAKWWFHLYATIQQFIDPGDNNGDKQNNLTTQQVIKTFQEFVEKSPLGEYESRLELLFVFHCHALYLPKSDKTEIIISVLWNLFNYYVQFVNNVDLKIKNLRTPIEKKLRDFVKIARWNDINYWAIKETVEKTHRTLHKYIKEFENVLKQSVTECLVNNNTDTSGSEQVGIWDRPTRHTPSQYHYKLEASNYMASTKFKKLLNESSSVISPEEPTCLLSKSEKYFSKSRNLCKDTIVQTSYPNLIQNLDTFVGEVIETSNHLKSLEINKELTKAKQKSQAKSILQQKRKALSDLFKTLAKCGLSYRTGIIEGKLRENSYSEYLLKPIDLKASFGHLKNNKSAYDRQLLNVWDGCETYFMRTIARLAALESALKQPAQDLGIQNIERCKGFSTHLMILAQDQKAKLIETTRNLYYLRHCVNQLTEWNDQSDILQTDIVKTIGNLITNVLVVMQQYKIVLLSCPEQSSFDSDLIDVPVINSEQQIAIKHKNDPSWNRCDSEINIIIAAAQKLKTLIDKLQNVCPASELRYEPTEYLFVQDKALILSELESLYGKVNNFRTNFGAISLANSINWLSDEIASSITLLKTEYVDKVDSGKSVEHFKNDVEKLMEVILVVIQNIYKKYNSKEEAEQKDSGPSEETDKSDLFQDNHLKTLIVENLFEDISVLEMKSVLRRVKKVIGNLHKMNVENANECNTLMSHCLPLLEQIVLLYQYFVTQQTSVYRVTCKMSSVLLNIFIELASKGFCVPQELADEQDSEGQTTQSGGMGLGEGEGEKDVSDRIENEDQLDDAQPEGQERKNEDKDCKEEDKGIEMSEDFEGKLQDVDKPEDEESQSNSDSDAEKQMGDTEPDANKLDQQIWGSDDEDEDDNDEEEEQSGKQDKEEKGEGGEIEDQQMAAKEDGSNANENEEDTHDNKEKKKEQQKDINEMDEPEYDEDQTDPYHGNQPQLPEPEPMDLPDDLQLDDGEEKEEAGEENPFDIDNMKEQMPQDEGSDEDSKKDEKSVENDEKGEDNSDSSDEEDVNNTGDMETDAPDDKPEEKNEDNKDAGGVQAQEEEKEQKKDDETENNDDTSAADNQQSNEKDIQPMDVDNIDAADNVQTNPNQTSAQNADQVSQEESNDKDGVGQSQMEESETGHRGEVNATKDSLNARNEKEAVQEKRQRPGESDTKRSLGETSEPVKKKLKTINIQDKDDNTEEPTDDGAQEGKDADMYQHIQEAKETDTQVLDTATKEQAETQKIDHLEDEKTEEPTTTAMDTDEPEPDVVDTPKEKAEKTEAKSQKKADGKQNQQGDIVEEIKDVEIEGDLVETVTVCRGNDTSYHTQYEFLNENQVERLSTLQIQDLRTELETQLGMWNEPPPNLEAEQTWEKISAITSSLARDLSEQLRLVLEPTQASRLRGDFRTGRRINMRKVIPYIASQFRKDKIWLRRTRPSKREYQIVLAIDDSSSMDDNHSKELAFESVALISKALSLLESGQLSVLSFGETTDILHKLTDTFTEKSGVTLLQKFQFQQKKTCVANLVDFVTTMLSDTHSSAPNAKLLIVVSDGRGIFSEGETFVQQAIRRAKFANIFMVFVIIDNPENKNSILDIRMPVFKDGKLLGIKSYLDSFPFPFYIILRDINSLPSVLSDALRQWFELVTNVDK